MRPTYRPDENVKDVVGNPEVGVVVHTYDVGEEAYNPRVQ